MRDDSMKWAAFKLGRKEDVNYRNIVISEFEPDRMTLISGPIANALSHAKVQDVISWPTPVDRNDYALAIRRDRILLVNGTQLAPGWDDSLGLAISDVSAGYRVCSFEGPNAYKALQRGAEISPNIPSGSVARNFSGYPVLLHAMGNEYKFRFFVPSALFFGLWDLLETYASAMENNT